MLPQRVNAHSPARLVSAAPHKRSECVGECVYLCRRAYALPMACSRSMAFSAVAATARPPASPPVLQMLHGVGLTFVIAPLSAQSSSCQTVQLRPARRRCTAGTGPARRTSPGRDPGGGRDVRRLACPTCGQAPSKLILVSGLRIEGAGEIQNAVLQC